MREGAAQRPAAGSRQLRPGASAAEPQVWPSGRARRQGHSLGEAGPALALLLLQNHLVVGQVPGSGPCVGGAPFSQLHPVQVSANPQPLRGQGPPPPAPERGVSAAHQWATRSQMQAGLTGSLPGGAGTAQGDTVRVDGAPGPPGREGGSSGAELLQGGDRRRPGGAGLGVGDTVCSACWAAHPQSVGLERELLQQPLLRPQVPPAHSSAHSLCTVGRAHAPLCVSPAVCPLVTEAPWERGAWLTALRSLSRGSLCVILVSTPLHR